MTHSETLNTNWPEFQILTWKGNLERQFGKAIWKGILVRHPLDYTSKILNKLPKLYPL